MSKYTKIRRKCDNEVSLKRYEHTKERISVKLCPRNRFTRHGNCSFLLCEQTAVKCTVVDAAAHTDNSKSAWWKANEQWTKRTTSNVFKLLHVMSRLLNIYNLQEAHMLLNRSKLFQRETKALGERTPTPRLIWSRSAKSRY